MSQDSFPAFFDEVKLVAEVSDGLAVFIAIAWKLYTKISSPVEEKIESPNGGQLSGVISLRTEIAARTDDLRDDFCGEIMRVEHATSDNTKSIERLCSTLAPASVDIGRLRGTLKQGIVCRRGHLVPSLTNQKEENRPIRVHKAVPYLQASASR